MAGVEVDPTTMRRALSAAEWLELEDGEWVDGYWVADEDADSTHELAVSWLIGTMAAWLGPRGFVF